MTRPEIAARAAEPGPWFHSLDLGGVATAPDHALGDHPCCRVAAALDAAAVYPSTGAQP